ncbi:MAG: recombination protein RmuC [Patescibacteria group bacterium]|nr:recombination protein RmuC [Patescibacteria group bacterium]
MSNIAWIILGILGGGIIVYLFLNKKKENSTDVNALNLLHQQMIELTRTLDQKLSESQKDVSESIKFQSSQSQNIIRDITERLTKLDETNKQVVSFTDQLQSLQDILKNPKQRGTILGEYYLETILSRVLPLGAYKIQYEFDNGDKVDAVVIIDQKIIPIDSKFSLENYNRIIEANKDNKNTEPFIQEFKKDIKKRIDETAKYIRPKEGTLEFAFMFIPHEAIYYDLLIAEIGTLKINTQDLIEYAFKQKVIIVSPTSFLAYLQTVHQGLKAMKVEKQAEEIMKNVNDLGKHLKAYEEYYLKLGKSLSTTVGHYTEAGSNFKLIDKDILRISGTSPELSSIAIEKPREEE